MTTSIHNLIKPNNQTAQDYDFMVVTNFAYEENIRTGAPVNIYSGLSDVAFDYLVRHSAENNGVQCLYSDGNTAIMMGTEKNLRGVESECGEKFSYAYCNEEGARKVLERCNEAANESPEEREMRQIPGALDYTLHLN